MSERVVADSTCLIALERIGQMTMFFSSFRRHQQDLQRPL